MLSRFVRCLSVLLPAIFILMPASSAQTFNCSSNGQRQECRIPGNGNPNDLRLVRQLSQNPCVEGRTWGRHGNRVWVDQGCRADFSLGQWSGGDRGRNDGDRDRRGPGWDGPPAYYAGQFRGGHSFCSASQGPSRTYCQSGGAFKYANPLRVSGNCVMNRTWGVTQYGLWVSNGCEGEWEIKRDGVAQDGPNFDDHRGPGWDRPPAYYAGNFSDGHSHCSANPGSERIYCQSNGAFRYANPLRVSNACVQNRTWGVSQYGLWVSNGCAGEWEIKR